MPARSLRAVAAAIAFLTRIPVGRLVLGADDVARGAALFPLVGAGIGAPWEPPSPGSTRS